MDAIKVLLVFGANINSLNAQKQTPTDIADQAGNDDKVRVVTK